MDTTTLYVSPPTLRCGAVVLELDHVDTCDPWGRPGPGAPVPCYRALIRAGSTYAISYASTDAQHARAQRMRAQTAEWLAERVPGAIILEWEVI